MAPAYGGHYSLPTTFLIDRQGEIRQRMIGAVDRATLEPLLQSLLEEPTE